MLSLDPERSVRDADCAKCGRREKRVKLFVLRDGNAYAVCFASLHDHAGAAVAWLDVIFGTWSEDQASDHVTFGCRVGPVEGQVDPAASLVTAAQPFADRPIFGRKLTRDQALRHPGLGEFWSVVDHVLVNDADVHAHVYGAPRSE